MTRWVLVSGGAVRLGREICLEFARQGWSVACHYRNSSAEAQHLTREIADLGGRALAIAGELASAADAEQLFHKVAAAIDGRIGCVVNNASTFLPDTASDFSPDLLLRQMQTNLVVPLTLARLLHAHALAAPLPLEHPSVVHVLDQKVFNLNPDYFSYTLSKLALERAVAQQAQALAPVLRVNAVAPGLMYPSGPQTDQNFAAAACANLLRRPVEPGRVAEVTRFLAENDCLTGVTVCADNGQHLVPLPRDIMFVVEGLLKGVGDGHA